MPHAGLERQLQLLLGLVVAVHVEPVGVESRAEREMELAPGGNVARQALPGEDPQHGRAREGLARVEHLVAVSTGREGVPRCTHPRAEVVLRVHVCRRSELVRQLGGVAPADLQPPGRVEARAEGVDTRQAGGEAALGALDHCSTVGGGHRLRDYEARPSGATHPGGPQRAVVRAVHARGGPQGRRRAAPRRRIGQGEPLRLRARLPLLRYRRAGLRRAWLRDLDRVLRPERVRRRACHVRPAARAGSASRPARVQHGRVLRSARRGVRRRPRGGGRHLPGPGRADAAGAARRPLRPPGVGARDARALARRPRSARPGGGAAWARDGAAPASRAR